MTIEGLGWQGFMILEFGVCNLWLGATGV